MKAVLKKVSIIGTVGLPPQYGGFETLADNITKNLSPSYDLSVFCSGNSYKDRLPSYNGANLIYINLNANGIQSILYDFVSIICSLRFAETILMLGVSGALALPIVKLVSKAKIVVNIDGLEWKRGKWGWAAKKFLKFSEAIAVKFSDIVVADNKVIQEYVKQEYKKDSVLIAYGGDHIKRSPFSAETIEKYPFLQGRYALNICRIEPENNIHLILEAFKEYGKLNLVVLGDWGVSEFSKKLKSDYSDVANIYLLGPMFDQVDVKNEIRSNSYVYIHGHSAGGTSPSLVEAMCMAKPVIAFAIDYNKETTNGRALYFSNVDELVGTLRDVSQEVMHKQAAELYEIAMHQYSWKKISDEYGSIF